MSDKPIDAELSAQRMLEADADARVDELIRKAAVGEGNEGRPPSLSQLADELNKMMPSHKDFSKEGTVDLSDGEALKPSIQTAIIEQEPIDYGKQGPCELRFDVPCVSRLRIEVYEPYYDLDGEMRARISDTWPKSGEWGELHPWYSFGKSGAGNAVRVQVHQKAEILVVFCSGDVVFVQPTYHVKSQGQGGEAGFSPIIVGHEAVLGV